MKESKYVDDSKVKPVVSLASICKLLLQLYLCLGSIITMPTTPLSITVLLSVMDTET